LAASAALSILVEPFCGSKAVCPIFLCADCAEVCAEVIGIEPRVVRPIVAIIMILLFSIFALTAGIFAVSITLNAGRGF
jgi:hypothetical protein